MLLAAGAVTFAFCREKKEPKQVALIAGGALIVSYLLFVWLAEWSGSLFGIVSGCVAFGLVVLYHGECNLQAHWKQYVAATLCAAFVAYLCTDNNNYDKDGYNFIVQHASVPSSMKLVSTVSSSHIRKELKNEFGYTYSKDLDFQEFTVEGTNRFGINFKNEYTVVYWKGKPIMMDKEGVEGWFGLGAQGVEVFKAQININTDVDSDKFDIKRKKD